MKLKQDKEITTITTVNNNIDISTDSSSNDGRPKGGSTISMMMSVKTR